MGPIRYEYDSSLLTRAEVLVPLPPSFRGEVWGVKLISASRARRLGQEACDYDNAGAPQTCSADREPGLILALLERPLADYRRTFEEAGMGDRVFPAQLDGVRGFGFTSRTRSSVTEYRFLPLEERTILVARQFNGQEEETVRNAVQRVIRSVANGVEDATG